MPTAASQPPPTDTPADPVPLFGAPTLKAQLPNILTGARLVMTVAFVAALSFYDAPDTNTVTLPIAAALFVVAALTDALDGFLARRWNAISVFGRVMDPLADKLLVLSAFVLLAGPNFNATLTDNPTAATAQLSGVLPWMTALILARELLITSLRGVCESRGIDFSASAAGKLKMIAQSVAVPVIITVAWATEPETAANINLVIAAAVTLATVYSAVPYTARAVAGLTGKPNDT